MDLWHSILGRLAHQQAVKRREVLLSTLIALLAMTLVTWISYRFLGDGAAPFIVASMGASTVLLAAVPSSPMNRAWPLLGSHLICAVIGVTCAQYIPSLLVAIPLAVATAILAMLLLRCLHPPGGATAMLSVLAVSQESQLGYQFVLTPVLLNAVVLWAGVRTIAFLLEVHEEQEHFESPIEQRNSGAPGLNLRPPFEAQDLHQALTDFDTFVDINEEELMRLYQAANQHYHRRHLGELRCSDVMIPNPVAAEFGTSLQQAWAWLGRHRVTGIPVVNCAQHVIGIVTVEDFIKHAQDLPGTDLETRIQALIRATPGHHSDKPEVVGQIMTQPVITAPESAHLAELVPLLDERKIHHLPVVNDKAKLVGVLHRDQIVQTLQQNAEAAPA